MINPTIWILSIQIAIAINVHELSLWSPIWLFVLERGLPAAGLLGACCACNRRRRTGRWWNTALGSPAAHLYLLPYAMSPAKHSPRLHTKKTHSTWLKYQLVFRFVFKVYQEFYTFTISNDISKVLCRFLRPYLTCMLPSDYVCCYVAK